MGGEDHQPRPAAAKAAGGPSHAGPANAAGAKQGRVISSGRVGEVVRHDPTDAALTFKLKFCDGQSPEADWFAEKQVELLGGPDGGGPAGPPEAGAGATAAALAAPAELENWATSARPAGTPVMDEGFICMGGKAPRCPRPEPQQASGPITLDTLQGEWLGSGGAQISVMGTAVEINSLPLKGHKVELREDGTVCSIGRLWQLAGYAPDGSGGLEFRASSTRENMDSARSEVWTRRAGGGAGRDHKEEERLRLLGYAGSAAAPLARGIEGCLPGTLGAEMPESKDAKDVAFLSALVAQWREPELSLVRSRQVVPDVTNRAQTGLGVELVHFVALSMGKRGFKKRQGTDGHDIPVVVREPVGSEMHAQALALWRERVAEDEEGFPPVRATEDEELFTSLGNGHFFQALNLYACGCTAINDPSHSYSASGDKALAEAISAGVPSLVLRHETPKPVRAKIADLLNAKRDWQWTLREDGTVDVSQFKENTDYCSQFEWLSKGMDAHQVNCLVRTHLGIKDSVRIQG